MHVSHHYGGAWVSLVLSNTETPQLIWNNGIRAELMDFVQTRQERALKGEPQPEDLVDGFAYSDLKPEVRSWAHSSVAHAVVGRRTKPQPLRFLCPTQLMVGDVYVRIYNEQPAFILDSFEQFAVALLTYLRRTAEILYKNMTPEVRASPTPRPPLCCC